MPDEKYYDVEGAMMRQKVGKPMEIYHGNGKWARYTGDESPVRHLSNPPLLDEVKP